MTTVVATAPTIEPVTVAEAKLHMRVDISADDVLIANTISAAREYCEKAARRTFIHTTYDLYLDKWPSVIKLPHPPISSVTGVYYTDEDGVESTFSTANYLVNTKTEPGRIVLKTGVSWPSTTLQEENGIRVRYVAGYGATTTSIPERYRQAILLLVGHWYENREAVMVAQGFNVIEMPLAVKSLLNIDRGGFF